jgi:hypothetical protein
MVVQLSKAAAEHIQSVWDRIIEGTAEEVDESAIDAEDRYVRAAS